ncbi:MAG TPA: histidine kinase, partial [Actinomycetota bacterium]|nr:histidine kinase [Actinomycetota bacterium]
VYAAVVVGAGALVGSSGNALLSAIAAALVALAFQPVRRWAQRLANRLVYGQRATPYEVLSEFSGRVAGSYDTEDVLPRMATVLGEGTGARRAQVWLRLGTDLRPAAVWPEDATRSAPRAAASAELPDLPDVSHAVPVLDRGELLGALSVTKGASDPITPTEQKLARDLSLQAGLVLRNVRLVEELRASRERLVAAQDDERRKIERDLHDGAQQQLVALAVKARLAETMVGEDEERERALLQEVTREAQETLESLRDLARGIFPPLLAEEGLFAALEVQSGKAPMPVAVRANGLGRYSREIEATVYFCVLEALQNAAKYADASAAEVVLDASDGTLGFSVSDDGRGFDPDSTPRGAGLQNMVDRIEAVGGALEVRSGPSAGTAIAGRIPVH